MSLQSTKAQLVCLLADEDTKVIALAGKWGTGKSHMWEEIRTTSGNEKVKAALYASFFGLSSIEQVKLKLIQSAVPAMKDNPGLWKGAKDVLKSGVKVLEGFHKSFGALTDVGLLLTPAILRQKLIVFDDIERKHEKLNIDEILGFIDEFTTRYECRFVLILNSDQLHRREVWNTLREKVVDEELRLSTSCAEAFSIALSEAPSLWGGQIAIAAEKCSLTNIRILQKIIKVVNRILADHKDLPDAVLSRVIPSTVLLAAIHYRGIENGPELNFVLSAGDPTDWNLYFDQKTPGQETEEDKREAQWRLLLSTLGIHSCDDFELLVVEYLQSGLFDVRKISTEIDRFIAETEAMTASIECNQFFEQSFWNHALTEEQLLERARPLVAKAHLLDAYMVTSLHNSINELPNGQALAEETIERWITAFTEPVNGDGVDKFFHRKVHPKIEALFRLGEDKTLSDTSIIDACIHISQHSGWGTRQEMVIRQTSIDTMETVMRTAAIQDLRIFMAKMLQFTTNKSNYERHFGAAMDNFIEACRRITKDPSVPRLAKIVHRLFEDANLLELLESVAEDLRE